MKFTDSAEVGDIKTTSEGYLVATARVARTGVQHYLASELGDVAIKAGFGPNDVVRVNRPESEVFSDESLNTITRMPITVDHPEEDVTADNWSKYAVGEVGDVHKRDGDWVLVNPMIKDSRGIHAAKTTHKEISMGYKANIVVAEDKSVADFEMRDIRYNHQALVPTGRAGHQARIGDSWGASPVTDNQPGSTPLNRKTGGHMTTKTVVLGDKAVQVNAEDAAEVERFKDASAKALSDAKAEHKAAIDAKDEEIGKLKADLKTAEEAAVVDVDALVAARSELVSKVTAIDSSITVEGKSDSELIKAAVVAKLGDAMVEGASESEISGMFKAIASAAPKNPVNDAFSGAHSHENPTINDTHAAYIARLTRQNKEA